jgi:prolyl oligopeptidase
MPSRSDPSRIGSVPFGGARAFLAPAVLFVLTIVATESPEAVPYPETPRVAVVDTLHGVAVADPYRWLEDGKSAETVAWIAAQERLTRSLLDSLPQRAWCIRRFEALWRYDDEGTPDEVLEGTRLFYWVKRKDDEKTRYWTKASKDAPGEEILNPNEWDPADQLVGFYPSRDGKYVAFGRARGGDESPVIQVMELATRRILPDTLLGWRQGPVSWTRGNTGFYYSAHPKKGEVPDGEENYWSRAYYHRLGTPSAQDRLVFSHPDVKEYSHGVYVSEDGAYLLYFRWSFGSKSEIYFQRVGSTDPPIPLATGLDAQYSAEIVGDKIYITTDSGAPMLQVFVTDTAHPGRASWRELIPEDKERKLSHLNGVAGRLYAVYETNAHTQIKIFDAEGRYLRDIPLPAIGNGGVSGYWSKPTVWVNFSSFTFPPVTYTYDFDADRLNLYKKFPLDIDVSQFAIDQVWYGSRDGTRISMFLIHRIDIKRDGVNPVLLTGYGGFNISMKPYFSTRLLVWLQAGGVVALPNLRGGGEYGRKWHEAGMFEKKQNVFDDFIAAAEWLIGNRYTTPEHLAIEGGSNGGLLVGAFAVQRPELCRAVLCEVPLLDMVRYHRFGYANAWAREYGSADDPDQFRYLIRYSPYQNVKDGIAYPSMLFVGSENDARVDPLHARKMVARLQAADRDGGPILLLVQKVSGHTGGTTMSTAIEQAADGWAFLMNALGVNPPAE